MRILLKSLLAGSTVFLLTGCSGVKANLTDRLEKKMISTSEIEEDPDYLQYLFYDSHDLLTEEGIPVNVIQEIKSYETEPVEKNGSVHITFATNPYISVYYSSDKNGNTELDKECYLNPGDTIYCRPPLAGTENSNTYHFVEFRVYTYDSSGNRSSQYETSTADNGIVYSIPSSFSGEGISIEPIGKFENRTINLHDYFTDNSGTSKEFSGKWNVNENDVLDTSVQVDSTDAIQVEYRYDDSSYYVYRTEPESLTNDNGIVTFRINDVLEEIEDYNIYLRHYITLNFKGDIKKGIASIKINTENVKDLESKLSGLKIGDRIIITAKPGYKLNCLMLEKENEADNQYTYIVPELNETSVDITVSNNTKAFVKQDISNGVLTVKYDGINNNAEVRDGDEVPSNTKVSVNIVPNDGYYLTGKNLKNGTYTKTMKYSDYQKDINSIIKNHPIKKIYSVTLDTTDPDNCGTVKYTLDKKQVSGLITDIREGQKLKITYEINKNSNYVIDRGKEGITSFINNKKKEEKEINISSDLDGKTITRDQYIKIKEGN